jgi:hypothetical protein
MIKFSMPFANAPHPRNPVDAASDIRPMTYARALDVLMSLDYIDGIFILKSVKSAFICVRKRMFFRDKHPRRKQRGINLRVPRSDSQQAAGNTTRSDLMNS